MNIRKLCKMLGATTTIMSLLVLAGGVTNTPVYAAEKALFTECKTAEKNNVLLNENKENKLYN